MSKSLLFLSWGSPWPAHGGGTLRTLGLLRQLSRAFSIHLLVLSLEPLSDAQERKLKEYACSITVVPVTGKSVSDKLGLVFKYIFNRRLPYHCALLHQAFSRAPEALEMIRSFPGNVYASYGHWGTLAQGKNANWILDQHNADVHFWRVYASQANRFPAKVAALINWRLAQRHFPEVYSRVGRIVSVCDEDRELTLDITPETEVNVIENGVDCSFFKPDRCRPADPRPLRLLFTGTSAPRNMTALRHFMRNIFPLVRSEIPDCELLVAGNFSPAAQNEFKAVEGMPFTGKVDDIRPSFNESDIYISPFEETHGSKLKISEAMAMGIPIVSTPAGVRGFELVDGESVLIVRNNAEFAANILRLARDRYLRDKIGANSRRTALATLDWQVLGNRLMAIVKKHAAEIAAEK
ncbi:glycosyltransferase, group 1 family protein [delta proteobacterium NaphS2]|nr:glycosyltransferase, group 1 family protein [delta proteobacterium NaphS2]